jgi:hypothetical protein
MNWEAIGAITGLVGIGLVIVSLIYVGIQVGQSNKLARSQSRQSLIDTHALLDWELSLHPDLVKILAAGLVDWTTLADIEKLRFDFFMNRYLANLHRGLLQHDDGVLDKEQLDIIADNMIMCILMPGGQHWFSESKTPTERVKKYVADRLEAAESLPAVASDSMPSLYAVAGEPRDT